MKEASVPYTTIILCVTTLLYSTYVAFDVTGSATGTVKIRLLEQYGGITFAHLRELELWRLFASQLIHVKQLHMLFNVLSLALLGLVLERRLLSFKFFLLWFVSGSAGTLASTPFAVPPWNLGTGGSQAVLGIAAFGLVLYLRGVVSSRWFAVLLCFTIVPAFALDFIYAGYPKLGHITGFLFGLLAGFFYCKRSGGGAAAVAPEDC